QGENGALVLVQGENRRKVRNVTQTEPYLKAEVETLATVSPPKEDDYWEAGVRNLRESADKLMQLRPDEPDECKSLVSCIEDPALLTDSLASNLSIDLAEKQKLLAETNVVTRVTTLQKHVNNQLHIAELQSKLRQDVQSEFSEAQKRA